MDKIYYHIRNTRGMIEQIVEVLNYLIHPPPPPNNNNCNIDNGDYDDVGIYIFDNDLGNKSDVEVGNLKYYGSIDNHDDNFHDNNRDNSVFSGKYFDL